MSSKSPRRAAVGFASTLTELSARKARKFKVGVMVARFLIEGGDVMSTCGQLLRDDATRRGNLYKQLSATSTFHFIFQFAQKITTTLASQSLMNLTPTRLLTSAEFDFGLSISNR
ncbi:hypothetical protein RRF57_012822 [Xylaria bambusicola]|uniref:Uncharacterized protein n=1 Tax=Xylaria bambusicola TaxID=326684 RepID=A0AAN7V258_9PEZI